MLPYQKGAAAMAIGAWLWAAVCMPACAATASRRPTKAERRYQKGLTYYAQGRRALALAAFQETLRLDPKDRSSRAAVQRITLETARSDASRMATAASPSSSLEDMFDDYLITEVPRYFRIERTVGDARSDQGTQEAMLGRVAQMMVERKFALAQGRTFVKERELRALVRRLPGVLT